MEKILVTGANGLLGTNLVINLLEKNYFVKALVRNKNNFINYSHHNLELVVGDIRDFRSVEPHAADCDYIIHSAANTSHKLRKVTDYDSVNFYGTLNIIEICKKHKIKRLIYIGSVSTLGHGSLNDLGNENKPIKPPFTKVNYALSKLKTQKLVDESCDTVDIVTISPSFMIGAYDTKPSSGRVIIISVGKKFLFYPTGGKNFVHVKDVAAGAIKALKQGRRGEKYILSNENLSYKEFFEKVSAVTNNSPIMIKLPNPILYFVGLVGGFIRFIGFNTEFSLAHMKALTVRNFYSNKKAKNDLGLKFSPIDSAIAEAIDWFKKENMI